MVCPETRLGFSVGLLALMVAGCSARSDGPPTPKAVAESRQPAGSAPSPDSAAAVSPQKESRPAEPKSPAPEQNPDPYEGLTAEKIALVKRVGNFLVPIAKEGIAAYGELWETQDRAKAAMRLSFFNVSLNQEAEKRVRAVLAHAKKADAMAQEHAAAVKQLWPNSFTSEGKVNPARDALRAAYEKALDEGTEFPPDVRRALGKLVKSDDLPEPDFAIDIEDLIERLRSNLLDQSVTGDHLFLMARAAWERGEDVKRRRDWTKSFYELVNALPPKHRTELLTHLALGAEWKRDYEQARQSLLKHDYPLENVFSPEGVARYTKELEAWASERRNAFIALEKRRWDPIAGYFHGVDESGWKALVALDEILGEFQKIVHIILPDLGYRFRPLLPADTPRDAAKNVLPKFPLPGSAEDNIPTIVVRDQAVLFDAPAGKPTFREMVKPGQVLIGTVEVDGVRSVFQGAELRIQNIERDRRVERVKGELRLPPAPIAEMLRGKDGDARTLDKEQLISIPFKSGVIEGNTLTFSIDAQLFDRPPGVLRFTASMGTGRLAGTITFGVGDPDGPTDGRFSFDLKK